MGSGPTGRWTIWLSAGLIGIFLGATLSEARLKSPTTDEPPHIAAGLSYFVTHQIFRADPQHPPLVKELSALSLMAAGIRWPHTADADYLVNGDDPARVFGLDWVIGNDLIRASPDRVLFWARLPMILLAALLGVLLYVWGRQLLGPVAAAGAVFVYVLDPNIVAHSQFVNNDVGVAFFIVLALWALWNYLQRPGWIRMLLCGACLGAALAAKFSGAILLPMFGILMLASLRWPIGTVQAPKEGGKDAVARRKGLCPCGSGKKYKNCHGREGAAEGSKPGAGWKLARAAGALGLMCIVAFVVVQATFFFPSDLTMYLKCARMVNADHDPNYLPYLAGELGSRFTSYFVAAYGLKEPLAGMILAGVGLVALIRSKSLPVLAKWFLLATPAAFFAATTALADDLGIRYIIPVLPFAHLMAGLGIASLWEAGRRTQWTRYAVAALCGWVVLEAAGIYPDHLSYFNEAACLLTRPGQIGWDGGSRCGPEWLDDSNVDWGQGLKQLKAWLDRHGEGRPVKLAITSSFPPEAYGIRYQKLEPADLMREPRPGLYAVSAHLVARIPAMSGASGWLRRMRPVAVVGHALYLYDVRAS
jgi:Dolichyl-phosphate-mannose-protein mannosyltransferase/SEC-C motif